MMKIATTLRYYATGTLYEPTGDIFGISKTSVKQCIREVSYLIASMLRNQFIYMPRTADEILEAKMDFMRLSDFPLCIAAVDGTHIPVRSFGGQDSELYRNRHMTFSINVQLAASADVCNLISL